MVNKTTIDLIAQCAEIPSFTTYEERMLPFIEQLVSNIRGAEWILVPENNVVIRISGNSAKPVIGLTAHLDKINHFGADWIQGLPVSINHDKIIGQLDDSVGLGLCLSIMQQSTGLDLPPLLLLLSEREEGFGLKHHPEWLRNEGRDVRSSLGAERISDHLLQNNMLPDHVITIDTTPLLKGERGLAIYTDHWEKNELTPSSALISATASIYHRFLNHDPELLKYNNTNDYLKYGEKLNRDPGKPVPSIALEPAIYPYHQSGEEVFLDDIARLEQCLLDYLLNTVSS